jgi:adhesin transport system outer membrane protein
VRAEETLILAEQDRFLTDYAALALTGDIIDVFAIPLPEVAP